VIQYISNFNYEDAAYVRKVESHQERDAAMIDDGGVWPATSIIAR
jgi:hypothetical protein